MRSGFSTIQQTLTPEASAVVSQSIAEARRRKHDQTTPLHVAAALLSSPSGYLRQACVRSHPNSSHPLQCRALELCFSVALERLPTAQGAAAPEPPVSNALMAALKRAQAHQRRGCPEQQQQPLLAVKVELDQLIISILDDPSVSRVMREASFSSPAVKAAIENAIAPKLFSNNPPQLSQNRNVYLNPRLLLNEEVKKVVEVMLRGQKRNPILVGDSEPEGVVRELLRKVESREFERDGIFKNVSVISMVKGVSVEEVGGILESRIRSGGVILDLGDLKWAVEQPMAVAEMGKVVARFKGDGGNKLWLIGTATCETYLRCQVYNSTMETDWDLQALPMAPRSLPTGAFPRIGAERLLSMPVEPLKGLPPLSRRIFESSNSSERAPCCPQCSENYEKEAAKLTTVHKSFTEASLPPWLQNAKLNTSDASQGLVSKQRVQELQRKWRDICLHLHPNFHGCRPTLSMASLHSPNLLTPPSLHLTLQGAKSLQLNTDQATHSPPGSPVRTDLVLGRKGTICEDQARDLLDCVSFQPRTKPLDKLSSTLDADVYKKLLKGLMEKAWWQAEAASKVASTITSCRSGNGRRRGAASRGDIWLLFTGPDRAGKKKMAAVIAEQICGTNPFMICLGMRRDDEEQEANFRGRTAIDRIAEVVWRNPFSVIMLQDIDEADILFLGSIKRAIERGRIADSNGREVSLGNAIFILTGDWSATNAEALRDARFVDEKKLAATAGGSWRLGLVVREKTSKRRASWLQDVDHDYDDGRPMKPRREAACGLSLDLNLAAGDAEDDRTDGSHNSSDLTIDHEEEFSHANQHISVTSVPHDLLNNVDESVVFKAVDSAFTRTEIKKAIASKFSTTVDENLSLEIEDDVLDMILGGLWHDKTSLQEWIEKVLEPSFGQLKPRVSGSGQSGAVVVHLGVESDSDSRGRSRNRGDWLPSSILV
ncbi:protein SUPPRESSOR OF MAX2 1-like [Salvia hispanica]|uniref:protein SUPPRESSOR OF MAX2 1-like n=1 Tax=Salvia hispanica TaxID=49212 RepID=UPI00200992D3|nr:protein SUPPRESSOR OF MAX2 1-like [Salvia hispanica]